MTFACLRASDGRLYFGGNAGFNSFYPRDILSRAPDAHIVLTSLQVKDRPPLTAVSDRISAPYAENDLSIEFAALNVINPGNLIYRFRLEPQESRWIETDSAHRVARYTDLSPGKLPLPQSGLHRWPHLERPGGNPPHYGNAPMVGRLVGPNRRRPFSRRRFPGKLQGARACAQDAPAAPCRTC